MRDIRVATAQFEPRDRDVAYNLSRIRALATEAHARGAELVAFHEACTTGYSFVQVLDRAAMVALAEDVPDGPTFASLQGIARDVGIAIGVGIVERDVVDAMLATEYNIYNTYVVIDATGRLVAKQRKLHPFVSPFLTPGDSYCVFEFLGCKWGILICYDNNVTENARCTALLGADIILAPHVTGGTASPQPGRGIIARELWENRDADPVPLRAEFRGNKGRAWMLRFLPCRAWENGVYYVFANNVGIDHDTVKPGNAMLLDTCGNVLDECNALGDGLAVALLTARGRAIASGPRYIRARRPELYAPLLEPNPGAVTKPAWARSWEGAEQGGDQTAGGGGGES